MSQNGYGTYSVASLKCLAVYIEKSTKKKGATANQAVAPRIMIQEEEEQIVGTQEKSQQIVAQRLLSCLQYLEAIN